MRDHRFNRLVKLVINHSCTLRPGERLLIRAIGVPNEIIIILQNDLRNVCLDFKDGRIVKAACNDTEKINEALDQEEGARYAGEFAFGF